MEVTLDKEIVHYYNGKEAKKNKDYTVGKVPVVKFDSHLRPFFLFEECCDHPFCTCNEIRLKFIEVEELQKPHKIPIKFSFVLDLLTWQELRKPEQRQSDIQAMIDAFRSNITEELKTRFTKLYADQMKKNRKKINFRLPVQQIKAGEMVSYEEVFQESPDSTNDGYTPTQFKHKEKTYYIDDYYCINPQCKCKVVHLYFFDFNEETLEATELFCGQLTFGQGFQLLNNPNGISKKAARNIFHAWKQSIPDLIETFIHRNTAIKKFGQTLIDEAEEAV